MRALSDCREFGAGSGANASLGPSSQSSDPITIAHFIESTQLRRGCTVRTPSSALPMDRSPDAAVEHQGVRQVSVSQSKTTKNRQSGQEAKTPVLYGMRAESPVTTRASICLHTAEATGSNPVAPTRNPLTRGILRFLDRLRLRPSKQWSSQGSSG